LNKKIDQVYREMLQSDPEKFLKDYAVITDKLKNSTARYKGKIIDFLYQPMFFDSRDIKQFKYIAEELSDIIEKCTTEFLSNPSFRKYFGYSEIMEELILLDPGYKIPAPIARFDLFYDEENFKICELNGDGTSAMNEANTLEQIFLESQIIKELQKDFDIYFHELFLSWLNELLNIYREFGGKGKPNIAITDFSGLGTNEEFDRFKNVFETQGYKTIICDPREMCYKNGRLSVKGTHIHLVYRRAVNKEVESRITEVEDLIQAYRDKAVCMVGPFRSQIMHNKIFFGILCDAEKTDFLNSEEREFIKQHIPETFTLEEDRIQKVMAEKDRYVIKPEDSYGGRNVVCGSDLTADEWKNKLFDAWQKGNFLIQEFSNFTSKKLPVITDRKIEFKPFKTTLGLFVYNGRLQGLYSRAGSRNVIAGLVESITLPSLVYSKK
jgi:glutathionylspermidine synthase